MALPTFTDTNPYAPTFGYKVTNEEVENHLRFVRRRRFNLSGGIAGGGEVPLFMLLPRSERVIVADHSYHSLGAAYLKATMMHLVGGRELRKMMIGGVDITQLTNEAKKLMPPKLVPHATFYDWTTHLGEIKEQWKRVPAGMMELASRRLDRLTFIHGDLMDLKDHGEFDFLYISNAIEHSNRSVQPEHYFPNVNPTLADKVASLVAPGKMILETSTYTEALQSKGTTLVERMRGTRIHHNWHFKLSQRPPLVPSAEVVNG